MYRIKKEKKKKKKNIDRRTVHSETARTKYLAYPHTVTLFEEKQRLQKLQKAAEQRRVVKKKQLYDNDKERYVCFLASHPMKSPARCVELPILESSLCSCICNDPSGHFCEIR